MGRGLRHAFENAQDEAVDEVGERHGDSRDDKADQDGEVAPLGAVREVVEASEEGCDDAEDDEEEADGDGRCRLGLLGHSGKASEDFFSRLDTVAMFSAFGRCSGIVPPISLMVCLTFLPTE